jgi:hypothetical protein
MSDYTGEGAVPVEDAAVDDPPTVDEVLAEAARLREQEQSESGGGPGDSDEPAEA